MPSNFSWQKNGTKLIFNKLIAQINYYWNKNKFKLNYLSSFFFEGGAVEKS